MKKSLLWLVAIPLIITSWLTYADNEHIVYDTANWTITVYTWDFSYGITIQDKNLWASVAWTWPTSYWYYFQRWNNHWNPEWSETVMQLIDWDDSYENHWYDWEVTKFINIHNGNNLLNQNYDYWVETSIGNGDTIYANWTWNNLWWGWNDNDDSNPKIVKWYDIEKHQATNLAWRQWPCESWYHVPSAWERNELVMLWCSANPDTCDSSAIKTIYNWGTYLMKDEIWTIFSNDLKLPFAGYRIIDLDTSTNNYFDSVQLKEVGGMFISSSVSDDFLENAFDFYIGPNVANPRGTLFRVDGDSVRCFKNDYIKFPKFTVTFLDDGEIVASWSVVSGGTWNETIPTVTKTWYKLDYRHLTWVDEAFDFTSPITWDITLYAKWSINKDIIIEATATEAGQTLKIKKYFSNSYTVDWWDGSPVQNLATDTVHTYSVASGYTITLSLLWADRWRFGGNAVYPLIPKNWTTVTWVKITYMPLLADWFWINAEAPWDNFFCAFNRDGKVTSLPIWSFDTSNIINVGTNYFYSFNQDWDITELPTGSFKFSSWLTTAWMYFFTAFNLWWKLTKLPEWSFDTSYITVAPDGFFRVFNLQWELKNLPKKSFDISNISSVWNYFFSQFNHQWALTSLPEWSFRLATWLTEVGGTFFGLFNMDWQLESLPEGAFDTSNISRVAGWFFTLFNSWWALTNLPDSFTLNSSWITSNWYYNAFNSPNYTLNKKVSTIILWITIPPGDIDAFSDNQPWRCGVHENWLVTTADACSISYDDGLWGTWEFKYTADTTWVVAWSGMVEPEKLGYIFSGWIDASWNNIEEVIFPDMDGQTLYANWMPNEYAIVFVDWSGDNESVIYSWKYNLAVEVQYPNWTKEWYTIHWDKEIPATMPLSWETITASWTKKTKPSWWSSGWWGGGWGWWGGSSSSCKNLPANAVANNSSTPSSNTNYYYSTNTSKVCTFQCKSGYTRNERKETCDKASDNQTTSWTNVKEPEANTWNNIKVETWNNTEIQTWSKIDTPEQTPQNDKQDTGDSSTKAPEWKTNSATSSTYSREFQEAYEFAKWNWITTMPTIQKANMEWNLTRIAMAKMLSQYAMNVLWQKPANIITPKFNDVTDKQNSDYDDWVTLAYQLWIMWQNMPNNNFRPNDEVTRAEFATALSRMAYWTSDWEYKWTWKYYIHHMEKLVKEWIITKDDPNMKELRGYVMIMLMRSAK